MSVRERETRGHVTEAEIELCRHSRSIRGCRLVIRSQGRGAEGFFPFVENGPPGSLILYFQPPEPRGNKYQLFKPNDPWCFARAALES